MDVTRTFRFFCWVFGLNGIESLKILLGNAFLEESLPFPLFSLTNNLCLYPALNLIEETCCTATAGLGMNVSKNLV